MRAVVVLVLVAAGCNQIYGLDKTRVVDAAVVVDRDEDGVLDTQDNCPDLANSGQENVDGDALGDACDACSYVFGPTLDRDGDGILTGVDNCPAADNADQLDADGDGIGDACDPNPGALDTVRCFDDFSTDVPAVWPLVGSWMWLGTASSAVIIHSPATAAPFSLAARASGLPAVRGAVQLEVQAPSTTAGTATGVAIGAHDLSAAVRCEILGTGSGHRLRLADASGDVEEQAVQDPAQRMLVTLAYEQDGATTQLRCTASRADGMRLTLEATSNAPIELTAVSLVATNAIALYHALAIYDVAP